MGKRRNSKERSIRRTGLKLAAVALGMFAFGYALVPLYNVICEVTGLNGKTGRIEAQVGTQAGGDVDDVQGRTSVPYTDVPMPRAQEAQERPAGGGKTAPAFVPVGTASRSALPPSMAGAGSAGAATSRWVTVEFTGNSMSGLPWEFHPQQKTLRVHPGQTAVAYYEARNTTAEAITGQAVPSVAPNKAAMHFKKIECFCFSRQTLGPRETRRMPVRFVVDANLPRDVHTVTLSYAFFNAEPASAKKYGGNAPAVATHEHHADHGPAAGG